MIQLVLSKFCCEKYSDLKMWLCWKTVVIHEKKFSSLFCLFLLEGRDLHNFQIIVFFAWNCLVCFQLERFIRLRLIVLSIIRLYMSLSLIFWFFSSSVIFVSTNRWTQSTSSWFGGVSKYPLRNWILRRRIWFGNSNGIVVIVWCHTLIYPNVFYWSIQMYHFLSLHFHSFVGVPSLSLSFSSDITAHSDKFPVHMSMSSHHLNNFDNVCSHDSHNYDRSDLREFC